MLQCSVLQSSVLQHVAAHLIHTHTSDTAQRLACVLHCSMLQCSVLQSSVLQHVAAHLILTHTSDTAQRLAGHGTHIKGKISQKSAHYSICHVQGLHSWLLRNFICDVPAGHSTHIKGTHSKFSKVSSIVILSSTFSSEQIVEKFECWACCAHQSYPFKFLKSQRATHFAIDNV